MKLKRMISILLVLCMALLLMHETAHVMGLPEQYEIEGHDHSGSWHCVMEVFEEISIAPNLLNFYHGIKSGKSDAFCSNCKSRLETCVNANYE